MLSVQNSKFYMSFPYICILYTRFHSPSMLYHVLSNPLTDLISLPANSPHNAFMFIFMYVYVDKQTDRHDYGRKHASAHLFTSSNCFALFPSNEKKVCKVWMAIEIPNLPSRLSKVVTAQKLCRTLSYSLWSNRTPKQGLGTKEKDRGKNLALEWNLCCIVQWNNALPNP